MLKYAVKLLIMAVANAAAIFIMNLNFNTSHVKVYQKKWKKVQHSERYFNTSHVKVYLDIQTIAVVRDVFQYISC